MFFLRAFPAIERGLFLWRTLVFQELAARYRATMLGAIWQLLAPLLQLTIYGWVFGVVFRSRWPGDDAAGGSAFLMNVFLGLVLHGVIAESVGQAPSLMHRHANFVRKVVFPLPVLVAVPLGVALVNAFAGLSLVAAMGVYSGLAPGWDVIQLLLLMPVFAAFSTLVMGLSLILAAFGVYLRDLGQVINMVVMAILFTSPVFFPRDIAPERIKDLIVLNPLTVPLEHVRDVVMMHRPPDWPSFFLYASVALGVLLLGLLTFRTLRRGFADLI